MQANSVATIVRVGDPPPFGFKITFRERAITRGSAVYGAASNTREGACAIFSGRIDPKEGSSTEDGAVTAPEYSITFSDLRPC